MKNNQSEEVGGGGRQVAKHLHGRLMPGNTATSAVLAFWL